MQNSDEGYREIDNLVPTSSSSSSTPLKKILHVPVMTPEKKIVHVPLMTPDRRPVELSDLQFNLKGDQVFGARIKKEDGDEEYILPDLTNTPVKATPIKQLPFSPSQVMNRSAVFCLNASLIHIMTRVLQFLNSPSLSFDVTPSRRTALNLQSTPVHDNDDRSNSPLTTPNPPPMHRDNDHTTPTKSRRSLTPKTPTPFKNALAELEKQSGLVKYTVSLTCARNPRPSCQEGTDPLIFFKPQTPTRLVEDITEIIKKEQDPSDSQYETDTSYITHSSSQVCSLVIEVWWRNNPFFTEKLNDNRFLSVWTEYSLGQRVFVEAETGGCCREGECVSAQEGSQVAGGHVECRFCSWGDRRTVLRRDSRKSFVITFRNWPWMVYL